jgi:hypothetical protein
LREFSGSGEERLPDTLFDIETSRLSETSTGMTAWQAFQSWNMQVQNFTRCGISVNSDKFPAIAGIAEQYSKRFGHFLGKYLAGGWENFLIEGMRWVVQPARKFHGRPKYRAPSWSWAACDGSVVRQSNVGEFELLAQAVGWMLHRKTKEFSYGELQPPGLVIVRGPFVAARMTANVPTTPEPFLDMICM